MASSDSLCGEGEASSAASGQPLDLRLPGAAPDADLAGDASSTTGAGGSWTESPTPSSPSSSSSPSTSDPEPEVPCLLGLSQKRTHRRKESVSGDSRKAPQLCSGYSAPTVPTAATARLGEEGTLFHTIPEAVLHDPSVPYISLERREGGGRLRLDAHNLLKETPLPKGSTSFSSVHLIVVPDPTASAMAEELGQSCAAIGREPVVHRWPELEADDVVGEYDAFFHVASSLILKGADRSSLVVFVAAKGDASEMAVAAVVGMLPFRGVQVAFVSPSTVYVDPLQRLQTASGLYEYDAAAPERMGRSPLAAIFGPLERRTFQRQLRQWSPLKPVLTPQEKPAPFKIGGLELPMLTFEGGYASGVERLAQLIHEHFGPGVFPIVACGETVDALGYASDILKALERRGCDGHYFPHPSGESQKRPGAYGEPGLLRAVATAKQAGRHVLVIAVGGGVNGNAMGTVAAMVGADFIEVPTTLMHYNDATTSAKKAFSLVVDGRILSKNIMGTFYLPQLVFCISETFLTLGSCSVHAAVGEATKTMSMLGNAKSTTGQHDFHNILGATEFASDFTRIIGTVDGFEELIKFLRETQELKGQVLAAGRALREARQQKLTAGTGSGEEDHEARRSELLQELRARFHQELPSESRSQIMAFLTVINEEIIQAKAMFLAYSDPFEKYRALLFEYAHTLGHGVEAFMNGLYRRAEALGLDFESAFRLHGQCVGMAVLWAGDMSKRLGHLDGDGYLAHQALVYLFNRFGGFDFQPLRRLCDDLDVPCEEFCEGVLAVVRRDNKRGYCKCSADASVDQLVQDRPGCLLRSADPSAELRYLVEVSEDSQRTVLQAAFEGTFDNILLPSEAAPHGLSVVPRTQFKDTDERAKPAAAALGRLLQRLCDEAMEGESR